MECKLDKVYDSKEKFYIDLINGIISKIPDMSWQDIYEAIGVAMPMLYQYGNRSMTAAISLQSWELGIEQPIARLQFAKEYFNVKKL